MLKQVHHDVIKVLLFVFVIGFCACDDYLDVVTDNVATVDYAFRDRTGAEKFLFTHLLMCTERVIKAGCFIVR
jgi:hypothetical protein